MESYKNKIVQALNYFALKEKGAKISKMKAYKLIWLADRYHLRKYGRTITHDKYCALPYGLVPSLAMNIIDNDLCKDIVEKVEDRKNEYKYFKSCSPVDINVFSKTDLEVFDLIHKEYGNYSAYKLSNISHRSPEWLKFEQLLSQENGKKSYPINIEDFFQNFNDNEKLFDDKEEYLSMSKEIFKYHNICQNV